jgi:hypothetical protein
MSIEKQPVVKVSRGQALTPVNLTQYVADNLFRGSLLPYRLDHGTSTNCRGAQNVGRFGL